MTRQVSPTAPFVTLAKVDQLRRHYLHGLPFTSLLEPGGSIYDLMRAVFPTGTLMLKEHFRCAEPIIRFSMQFYPERMLPLRIPAADERLDPPLVDIYVPHGAREKKRPINRAEADVIVEEIRSLASRPEMQRRTVGVISLIGGQQAELIRSKLSESIGEEVMQRHKILCGDSATFQGTERDIVFLSMVADPTHCTALTMLRYEQRFNVAVSRARDRLVLVRSVRREELNAEDLKARLIAHFDNPMLGIQESAAEDRAKAQSDFERAVMRRLLDRGYRVHGQVGSRGFHIDMVVEGAEGRRLAVECDGDRFHGPEQWRGDLRRQRVLERVGWRFWRCFGSSFYCNPDGVMADLFDRLSRMGIEPLGMGEGSGPSWRYTEHRVAAAQAQTDTLSSEAIELPLSLEVQRQQTAEIEVGDKVVLRFADDQRSISGRLTADKNDQAAGLLAIHSPIGAAILGAEEGDEVELRLDDGRRRKVLIESVQKRADALPRSSGGARVAIAAASPAPLTPAGAGGVRPGVPRSAG